MKQKDENPKEKTNRAAGGAKKTSAADWAMLVLAVSIPWITVFVGKL